MSIPSRIYVFYNPRTDTLNIAWPYVDFDDAMKNRLRDHLGPVEEVVAYDVNPNPPKES